jgi:hypothetical protein
LGDGTLAAGDDSLAGGFQTQANGNSSTALGLLSIANGAGSFASGSEVQANGFFSTALGFQSVATGLASVAQGELPNALREGQVSQADGAFSTPGDAQTSTLVLRGSTPGTVVGEMVELTYGRAADQFFTLEDDKAYTIDYEVIAFGLIGGVAVAQTFTQVSCWFQRSGLIHFSGETAQVQFGDPGGSSWTFSLSIVASPERISFTFSTGSTTAAVQVTARVVFTEVAIG